MIENFFRRPAIDRNAGRALVQSDGASRERAGSAIDQIEIELLLAQKLLYFFDVATGELLQFCPRPFENGTTGNAICQVSPNSA